MVREERGDGAKAVAPGVNVAIKRAAAEVESFMVVLYNIYYMSVHTCGATATYPQLQPSKLKDFTRSLDTWRTVT